jgi:hypothetical protein
MVASRRSELDRQLAGRKSEIQKKYAARRNVRAIASAPTSVDYMKPPGPDATRTPYSPRIINPSLIADRQHTARSNELRQALVQQGLNHPVRNPPPPASANDAPASFTTTMRRMWLTMTADEKQDFMQQRPDLFPRLAPVTPPEPLYTLDNPAPGYQPRPMPQPGFFTRAITEGMQRLRNEYNAIPATFTRGAESERRVLGY